MTRLLHNVRVAGGAWNADQIGAVRGHVYASRNGGDRMYVRQARESHECNILSHAGPAERRTAIAPGDAYIESMLNGTRQTGQRICVDCAVRLGELLVDPPLERWDPAAREWVS